MISKKDDIRRITCADMTITQVIKGALTDNLVRYHLQAKVALYQQKLGRVTMTIIFASA